MDNLSQDMIDFFSSFGADIQTLDQMEVIKSFTTVENEIFSLNNGTGLRYMNTSGIVELKGVDSLNFLNRISTNSMTNLSKEEIRSTIFTSEKGLIIGVSTVLNFESYLLLVTSIFSKPKVLSWINKYIIGDDIKVSDASHRFNIFEVMGPQSESFLSMFVGDSINSIPVNSFKVVNAEGVLFFLARFTDLKGFSKFWILAEHENSKKLINYLVENKGPFDFNLIGEDAYNVYKIENGIPSEPNEINYMMNPYEVKLFELIDFKKGSYIGQEVITRLNNNDLNQKNLIRMCFSEPIEADEKFVLFDAEKNEIGNITSIAFSPKLKKSIALGFVKNPFAVQGTKVLAKNETKSFEVVVNELPQRQ
jgi:folate-binding protein YgfZ